VVQGKPVIPLPLHTFRLLTCCAAPRWTQGYSVNIAFTFFTWLFFIIGQYLYRRDEKKRSRLEVARAAADEEDSLDLSNKAVGDVVEHIEERK